VQITSSLAKTEAMGAALKKRRSRRRTGIDRVVMSWWLTYPNRGGSSKPPSAISILSTVVALIDARPTASKPFLLNNSIISYLSACPCTHDAPTLMLGCG